MIYRRARQTMVREQLVSIHDPRVLRVMNAVPRHLFVDEALAGRAYGNATLPIGNGQTLSQPYTVARMTEALALTGEEEVLEIGTGSGYQTAVLARLSRMVYTIERVATLADTARQRLRRLGFLNVSFRVGDGSLGWPEPRRFDRILVAAGTPVIPENLTNQLAVGGSLLIPEGNEQTQHLIRLIRKEEGTIQREVLEACRFVPLVGEQGWREATRPAQPGGPVLVRKTEDHFELSPRGGRMAEGQAWRPQWLQ
ncbi:MAG: protein-L-isoaspartate(D-aspartate) O-methyltransferase [Magnetococcales bacterium]|nr:protein-L-isoaspartate(D-aspartate) O-methyltransferase [Magnetococcales bacterium]